MRHWLPKPVPSAVLLPLCGRKRAVTADVRIECGAVAAGVARANAYRVLAASKRIAREKGPLNLFALFEHEDSAGYVDVIVIADWASRSKVTTKRYLSQVFAEELELEDRYDIGPIFVFDPVKEGVDEASRLACIEHGLVEVRDVEIYGARIRRGYFITSSWPAIDGTTRKASTPRESSTAAKSGSRRTTSARRGRVS